MVLSGCYFYIIFTLVAVNIIAAQQHSEGASHSSLQRQSPFGFNIPSFFGPGISIPQVSEFIPFNVGSRNKRNDRHETNRSDDEEKENHQRCRSIVPCNHTTNPGRSCMSCNEIVYCSNLNIGVAHTCRGILSYCNEGFCSEKPDSTCNSTETE